MRLSKSSLALRSICAARSRSSGCKLKWDKLSDKCDRDYEITESVTYALCCETLGLLLAAFLLLLALLLCFDSLSLSFLLSQLTLELFLHSLLLLSDACNSYQNVNMGSIALAWKVKYLRLSSSSCFFDFFPLPLGGIFRFVFVSNLIN